MAGTVAAAIIPQPHAHLRVQVRERPRLRRDPADDRRAADRVRGVRRPGLAGADPAGDPLQGLRLPQHRLRDEAGRRQRRLGVERRFGRLGLLGFEVGLRQERVEVRLEASRVDRRLSEGCVRRGWNAAAVIPENLERARRLFWLGRSLLLLGAVAVPALSFGIAMALVDGHAQKEYFEAVSQILPVLLLALAV